MSDAASGKKKRRKVGIYDRPRTADISVRKLAIILGLLLALIYFIVMRVMS